VDVRRRYKGFTPAFPFCRMIGEGGYNMKICRDQRSHLWLLQSESHVLYKGRKSPWDHPSILREAQRREAEVRSAPHRESRGPV
jgi:hypothetical protein